MGLRIKSSVVWLDGKKTLVGVVVRFGLMATNAFAPTLLTPDQYSVLIWGADILAGVGAADKLRKGFVVKNK